MLLGLGLGPGIGPGPHHFCPSDSSHMRRGTRLEINMGQKKGETEISPSNAGTTEPEFPSVDLEVEYIFRRKDLDNMLLKTH